MKMRLVLYIKNFDNFSFSILNIIIIYIQLMSNLGTIMSISIEVTSLLSVSAALYVISCFIIYEDLSIFYCEIQERKNF